ncbi:MAG: AbrB/MazE/SpoVT family DNA-binding domain-containing protein [Anaerolineales bacterium]|nr:AbrB/MazE/SpoVT family DNA-binding domain-containing protein [Anaerolineales bacterium]
MNLARVSSNGQVTVPVEIRRKLYIKEGDKILFLENAKGEIVLLNSSRVAIREAQAALRDVPASEEEILQDIMELRYSKKEQI